MTRDSFGEKRVVRRFARLDTRDFERL
jgi:hypothetical protein